MTATKTAKTELKIKMTNGDNITVTFDGHTKGSSVLHAIRQLQDEKLVNEIFQGCIQQGDFSVLEFVPKENAVAFLLENNLLPPGTDVNSLGDRPWEAIGQSPTSGSEPAALAPIEQQDDDFGGLPRATI